MMEFTESLSIVLPNVQENFKRFQESAVNSGLIIEIAAIHEGLTSNFNNYSSKELTASIESWVQPYPRPIIINHDSMEDPLGRVMAAKMGKEDGLPCVMLQAAISKPEAIERFMDKRYLTGSVGGKVDHAVCSVCDADWATASMFGPLPCEHERGKLYKGKLASLEMQGINWKEYSMVNTPADAHSGVKDMKSAMTAGESEGTQWVKAHLFSVDMNKESVIEFTESGDKDLLAGTKRKIAVPLYHNMRGSFLSVLAISEEEQTHEENDTVSENANEDKEDILGIAESLSDDLADDQADDTEAPDEADESTEDDSGEEVTDAPEADEEAADEDLTSDEEVDGNTDEEDEGEEVASDEEATEEPEADESDEEAEEDETEEEDADPAEAGAELAIAQERIVAFEAQIAELSEENLKLRSVLKKGLAERVVDRKIDLSYEDIENRSTLIEEHVNRSASSLADSLRDLMKVRPAASTLETAESINFQPVSGSKIVKGDKRVTTIPFAEESKDEPIDPADKYVNVLTEALMGRRTL